MKKRIFKRKRRSFGSRKRRGSSKFAKKQQRGAMTWIRKKYTRVFTMDAEAGSDSWNATVSLIAGKNANAPADTVTLTDVNQDFQLQTDMGLYQFFRIRGVAIKMFFPMPTDVASSPVQWTNAYSANEIMLPALVPERVQTLATYQTGACNQNKAISRYYNTAATFRRFGIQYCDTSQFGDFAGANALYGTQLQPGQGSSVNLKVYRQEASATANVLGRLQVTYYVTYKGNKGRNSLVNP